MYFRGTLIFIIIGTYTYIGTYYYYKNERTTKVQRYGAVSPKNVQNFKMTLRHILHIKNNSNVAHTLLSTIKSYDANPSEKNNF